MTVTELIDGIRDCKARPVDDVVVDGGVRMMDVVRIEMVGDRVSLVLDPSELDFKDEEQ